MGTNTAMVKQIDRWIDKQKGKYISVDTDIDISIGISIEVYKQTDRSINGYMHRHHS